jgi:3-polyprenyl-4-hydroxybenzoate decarboxylase
VTPLQEWLDSPDGRAARWRAIADADRVAGIDRRSGRWLESWPGIAFRSRIDGIRRLWHCCECGPFEDSPWRDRIFEEAQVLFSRLPRYDRWRPDAAPFFDEAAFAREFCEALIGALNTLDPPPRIG